jgi:hypothetical protein
MQFSPRPDLYLNDMTARRADVNILKCPRSPRVSDGKKRSGGRVCSLYLRDARKDAMINLQDLAVTQNQQSRLGGHKQPATKQ